MRAHHALAVVAVLIVATSLKFVFYPPIKADAEVPPGVNVLQIQTDHPNMSNMPVPKIHDMRFVFADGD